MLSKLSNVIVLDEFDVDFSSLNSLIVRVVS